MSNKKILILLLGVLYTFTLFSQKTEFNVEGTVMGHEEQEPLAMASISIWKGSDSTKTVVHVITDKNGYFNVPLKTTGNYKIKITYVGKAPLKKTITIVKSFFSLGDLYLKDSEQMLNAIYVERKRRLVKIHADKLVYDVKNDPDANASSVLEILEKVPMVSVDGDDKIEIGGNSDLKIYVNGRPSTLFKNNPAQVLRSMSANAIKNIEVISNPGSKYDAEGTGGIINLTMDRKTDDGYSGTVSAEADCFGAYSSNVLASVKSGKLGVVTNYTFRRDKTPFSDFSHLRHSLKDFTDLKQEGKDKSKGITHLGYIDLSYDFNERSLLNVSFNAQKNNEDGYSELYAEQTKENGESVYTYNQNEIDNYSSDSYSISSDFQQYTVRKGEYISISYKFDNSNKISDLLSDINNTTGHKSPLTRKNRDKTKDNEHTFQIDFVSPISEVTTLEFGSKYIARKRTGSGEYSLWDAPIDEWHTEADKASYFGQKLDILALYNSYSFKFGDQWGLNTGARIEYTRSRINIPETKGKENLNEYFNLAPTLQGVFRLNDKNNFTLNYNMRINRPGLSYLNPYVNDSDPTNIYFGNPVLEAIKKHKVALSYNYFGDKIDLNANLSHSMTNNSIQQYSYYKNGVINNTFDNFGKQQESDLQLYMSWTPNSRLRLNLKGTISYVKIKSKQDYISDNSGFSNRVSAYVTYKLPADFRINVSGGYYQPSIRLQTKGEAYHYSRLSLRKELFEDNLSISLSVSNPFTKRTKYKYTTISPDFNKQEVGYRQDQNVKLKVVFRFGRLNKKAVNKTNRNIINDDTFLPVTNDDEEE